MQSEHQSGGLFPANTDEFNVLMNKPRGPSLQLPSPEEIREADRAVNEAVREKVRRLEFDQKRVELGQELVSIFYDDVVWATNQDYASQNTRENYRALFSAFQTWCAEQEHPSLPSCPEVVVLYLLVKAGEHAPLAQLQRIISAVRHYHRWAEKAFDTDDVLIRAAMRWIKRRYDEQKELDRETTIKPEPEPQQINGSGKSH